MDNAIGELKANLGRNPTAKEVEDFLNVENPTEKMNDTVDPNLVKDIENDLKELLGR